MTQDQEIRWVVLQCEAMTDIDVTAADMLDQLDTELNQRGVHLAFVELRTRLHRELARYGLLGATLAKEHFYETIEDALADIRSGTDEAPGLVPTERHPDQPDRVD